MKPRPKGRPSSWPDFLEEPFLEKRNHLNKTNPFSVGDTKPSLEREVTWHHNFPELISVWYERQSNLKLGSKENLDKMLQTTWNQRPIKATWVTKSPRFHQQLYWVLEEMSSSWGWSCSDQIERLHTKLGRRFKCWLLCLNPEKLVLLWAMAETSKKWKVVTKSWLFWCWRRLDAVK